MAEKLMDIDITREELDRIGEAMKQKEFRDLLTEYCDEISDPKNRKIYEEEMIQLEKERGVDVTFVNPEPGYVIKSSIDGNKIAFINICHNQHVQLPTSERSLQGDQRGSQWSLPHLLAPPRDDLNKKGKRCTVYDIIFHPKTLHIAYKNNQFREMVNKIACEAVESNFNVVLDKNNLKFPKMKYKGIARPLVIRKKVGEVKKTEEQTEVDELYSNIYKQIDDHYENTKFKPTNKKTVKPQTTSEYTAPKYLIKYRNDIDMQDFTIDKDVKLNATVPKELVIEIILPLLKSASDFTLDVTEKSLQLISKKPSKYKLDLTLPYAVNENNGNAKFDIDSRKLVVTLPVNRKNYLLSDIGRYDSGVDSDNSPLGESPSDKNLPLIQELNLEDSAIHSQCENESGEMLRTNKVSDFLNSDLHYSFPENSCHLYENILSFTLNVKNVNCDSVQKKLNESCSSVHIKFCSISSGYFPVNYAFYVRLPSHVIDPEKLSVETWDNNIIIQIPYLSCDTPLSSYFVGTNEEDCQEKIIEEPSIIHKKHTEELLNNTKKTSSSVNITLDSDDELTISVNSEIKEDSTNQLQIQKQRSLSESSVEESQSRSESEFSVDETELEKDVKVTKNRSISESCVDDFKTTDDNKGKSILKNRVSRSVSESNVDDFTWSSVEHCDDASESSLTEKIEGMNSNKKTVRFNSVVSRQLYRSNSSILGQRKKNQRKNRNKKRAQERRFSESETSETEDKKLQEKQPPKTIAENFLKVQKPSNEHEDIFNDPIFSSLDID